MRILMLISLLVAAGSPAAAGTKSQADWTVLEAPAAMAPAPARRAISALADTVRVLIAGDSWAQYMWDDGVHDELLDRFGLADRRALSQSLGSNPGPGSSSSAYAISGSEAREWADPANYPWTANLVNALQSNPHADTVFLSIGGNDVLAGKPDGGWYKDMDLDVAGSEAALFEQIRLDTQTIIQAAQGVRPNVDLMIGSYDYPNFDVGFWCFTYACPKRRDLSRDPDNDLITNAELNDMMVRVETARIGWANGDSRLHFDHSVGLMHHFYGDGQSAAGVLDRPGPHAPDFLPFPGGNVIRPTLRSNFRQPGGIDADPIHLDREGYQYKVAQQLMGLLFARLRPAARSSFTPANGGWSDGVFTGGELRVGSALGADMRAILEFDLSSIPSSAVLHGATLWLQRQSGAGTHPFASNQHGPLVVDTVAGGFGSPGIEPVDYSMDADHLGNGEVAGSASPVGAAIRIELDAAALVGLAGQSRAGFRIQFDAPAPSGGDGWLEFSPPGAAAPGGTGLPTWADLFGDASPQLDLRWSAPTASPAAFSDALMAASPSPFRWSTQLRFVVGRSGPVELSLYDLRGRKLRTLVDADLSAGGHQFAWDGRDESGRAVAAGSYVLRLRTPQGETRGKILRLAN